MASFWRHREEGRAAKPVASRAQEWPLLLRMAAARYEGQRRSRRKWRRRLLTQAWRRQSQNVAGYLRAYEGVMVNSKQNEASRLWRAREHGNK